jgi:Cu(I)/Ag(I) efflux system membrane protein CusA/SilA
MIDRIIQLSVRYRFVVIALAGALALGGFYALAHTPVDAIPDLSENQIIVFTEWAGHSPREIEDQVTYPLSIHLQGVSGVRVVRSASDYSFSMINVILDDGADYYSVRRQLAERLAGAALLMPSSVTPALAPDAAATGQIFWYTVEGPGYDLGRLRSIQDWYVRHQLSSVPGVAEVASVGGFRTEYHIDIDPIRLRGKGLTVEDLEKALAKSNSAVGGNVVTQGNSEYLVRGVSSIGANLDGQKGSEQAVRELENVVILGADGHSSRMGDVARVTQGPGPRRGVLEKDGNEVTGGVVLMRQNENPLVVTRRVKEKIQELQAGLSTGVRIIPFYDRTPLIEGAIGTVTRTLLEAILTATVCVLLVLLHFRTSFIIAITLPLAVLSSFVLMWLLRSFGLADIQTNIMSLAGIAISIGVLVDSSIVMAENSMHVLKTHFGDRPVKGDIRDLVVSACRTVGRPIFFSVVIMLLSFLPIFALGGMEGKMFRPLAFTKSFALLAVAVLAITLVPALCTIFIKGRLRTEQESWLVRSVTEVYRPVLNYLLDRPAALVWILGITFIVGLAPLGSRWVFFGALLISLLSCAWFTRTWRSRAVALVTLIIIARVAEKNIEPLGREFMTPLNEGMTMDMPLTWPRASVAQSADDLKARDMIMCRFPEVDMVVGKGGRAETATDPAPIDMIETMVDFRPRELWPRRRLHQKDAESQAAKILQSLCQDRLVGLAGDDRPAIAKLPTEATAAALPRFDAFMRETSYQSNQDFERQLTPELARFAIEKMTAQMGDTLARPLSAGDIARLNSDLPLQIKKDMMADPSLGNVSALARETAKLLEQEGFVRPGADVFQNRLDLAERAQQVTAGLLGQPSPTFFGRLQEKVFAYHQKQWRLHLRKIDSELVERASPAFTRLALEEILNRVSLTDSKVADAWEQRKRVRSQVTASHHHGSGDHHGMGFYAMNVDPIPALDSIIDEHSRRFAKSVMLWQLDWSELVGFGGELDRVMQMPGWTNVWTAPIQNRVDMLSTGVNTTVGIRVLGRRLEDVVQASEDIAAAVKNIPGATNVIAEPIRGKGYLEIRVDREKAARLGVAIGEVNDLVETALGGKVVTTTIEGRERHPVRVRYASAWRDSEEAIRNLALSVPRIDEQGNFHGRSLIALSEVAEIRTTEGPAKIKSENGTLRNYVTLNVRGVDAEDFVASARRLVAEKVHLPAGVFVEWTGQFEHEARSRNTLAWIVPVVIVLIFLILYWTYRDWADAVLMLLAVPGAIAGGVFFQWLFGFKFSVTVWVGYIACFGMATATGIIMLVYLREAVARAGGLAHITLEQLRQAVMDGAVHRLRPKLLTELTCVIGLAPLLWANGTGAEVIRPMVVPVLGGILIADEVIDLFLPVLFFWVRRRRWHKLHPAGAVESTESSTVGWAEPSRPTVKELSNLIC